MKSATFIVMILVLCVFALGTKPVPTDTYEIDDAYRVYSVLLPNEESFGFARGRLVIQRETVSKPSSEVCLTAEGARTFRDAVSDFERVNSKQWFLERHFEMEKPYELVAENVIGVVFQRGGWDGFYKSYPGSGGYITLSAVGFNANHTRAVVYTGSHCGYLCGTWGFHLLEKISGKWTPVPGVSCVTVS